MSATSHTILMLDVNKKVYERTVEKGVFLTSVEQSSWQLREGCAVLPQVEIGWSEIYRGKPWSHLSNLVLSPDRTTFLTKDGKVVLKSHVRQFGAAWGKESVWLEKMFTYPNSQVKNFMNACRATFGIRKPVCRIAVVGSKSREGSGLWHKLFAMYALSFSEQVFIDFFDPAEIEQYWEYSTQSGTVTCAWIPDLFPVTEMSDYDVVIDDAWLQGSSSLGFSIPFGSQKQKNSGKGDLFLHPTERRLFTSETSSYISPCSCCLCVEISKCVTTFVQYQILRMYCSRLGHYTGCDSAFYTKDLNVVAGFLREMTTSAAVDLRTKTMVRGLLSVCEEIPLEVERGTVHHGKGAPKFEAYSRYQIEAPVAQRTVHSHLSQRKVVFIGVSPSVLGDTPVKALWNSACHVETGVDFVFVNSARIWSQVVSTPFSPTYVYVPEYISGEMHPDWEKADMPQVDDFVCWMRKKEPEERLVFKPCQLINGVEHPPTSLYPVLDVSVLGRPLQVKSSKVVTPVLTWFTVAEGKITRIDEPTFQAVDLLFAMGYNGEWSVCNNPKTPSGSIRVGTFSIGFFSPLPPIDVRYLLLIGKRVSEQDYLSARDLHGDMFEVALTDICKVKPSGKKKGYNEGTLVFRFKNVPVPLCFLPYLAPLRSSPFYKMMEDFDKWDSVRSEWDKLWRIHSDVYVDARHSGKEKGVTIHPHEKFVAHQQDVGENIVLDLLKRLPAPAQHHSVQPRPGKKGVGKKKS